MEDSIALQSRSPLQQELDAATGHLRARRWRDAEAIYRRLLEQHRDKPELHYNLGVALKGQNRFEEAVAALRAALALRIDIPEVYNSLGDAYRLLNRPEEGLQAFYRALALRPEYPEALNNQGILLHTMGRQTEAIVAFQRALVLRPNYAMGWNNLGIAMRQAKRQTEAIDAYRKALDLDPDLASAWSNLSLALMETGQLDEAIVAVDHALVLQPDYWLAHGNKLCMMHYHAGYDAVAIYQEARVWNDRYAKPLSGAIPIHDNDPDPRRRLRIGYVSADFEHHVLALFLTPLLANHDRREFEIYCYSNVATPDTVTARLRRHSDVWRDIAGMNDPQVADLVHQDKIDILVDLALHTAGGRLLVFARKPAPIQVTWLGYPGTTGMEAIDYRLTDPRLDPPEAPETQEIRNSKFEIRINDQNSNDPISNGSTDQPKPLGHSNIGSLEFESSAAADRISNFSSKEPYYSERSVRLPDSFWIFDPHGMDEVEGEPVPQLSPLPARHAGFITFGCLNNFCKVSDGTLELFARVLAAVPGSRIIMMAQPGPHQERALQKLGLPDRQRIRFLPYRTRRQYLETFHVIDLCLDTLPYNGHTTTLDSLWMGVPVITLVGKTVVGRAGWSHLHNLGMTEMVARTPEQFVSLAVELAGNLDHLAELRANLRRRMEQSPLMDGPRFVKNLENIYRRMWQAWCARAESK